MKTASKTYEIFYVSSLAADAPLAMVGAVVAHARIANAARDITGVLVFDGLRFCQHIEGKQEDVLALMERIYQDTRHVNIEVFHHGPVAERRFNHFSMAFANVEDMDVLERLEQLSGQQGVDTFMALIATLNLQA